MVRAPAIIAVRPRGRPSPARRARGATSTSRASRSSPPRRSSCPSRGASASVRSALSRMIFSPIQACARRCRIARVLRSPRSRCATVDDLARARSRTRAAARASRRRARRRASPSRPASRRSPRRRRGRAAVRAPSKNTSLNSEVPVICTMGRTSMPGCRIGTSRYERPLCFGGARGPCGRGRSTSPPAAPRDVQIFCPVMTHSPPSRTARVCTFARSLPALGSE